MKKFNITREECKKNSTNKKYLLEIFTREGQVLKLYHAFKRIIKECGLPTMRFHDLRHSYAVLCIDLNTNIKVLSLTMGHSSVSVTDEVYADSIAAKNNLANKISDVINNV